MSVTKGYPVAAQVPLARQLTPIERQKIRAKTRKEHLAQKSDRAALRATPLSKISKAQDVNGLLTSIRSTVMHLANGEEERIVVEDLSPSRVVVMVYNNAVTTAQITAR